MGLVDKAYEMCHEFDIKWKRPDDYFAEMIKSDEHMLKVTWHLTVSSYI